MTADLADGFVSDVELGDLRERYEAGASVSDLAGEYGLTQTEVRTALKRAGATLRRQVHATVRPEPRHPRETLAPISLPDRAARRGRDTSAPREDTTPRTTGRRTDPRQHARMSAAPTRKDAKLRTAYEAGATMRELAAAHGMTRSAVESALKRAGTIIRARGSRYMITDAAELRELYVDRAWTITRIARHYGCYPQAVDSALVRFGIPKRKRYTRRTGTPPCDGDLQREYEAGATTPELAAAHDMSCSAVRSALIRAGTAMRSPGWPRGRPRGPSGGRAGGHRPTGRHPVITDAAELRELYVDRGLSIKQVAEHYGRSVNAVRGALRRFGIPARRPGDWKRSRTGLDVFTEDRAVELRELYTQRRWSIERIAAHYGCGVAAVRSALHRFGILAPRNDPVLGAQLRSDYEAGATLAQLAAAHGLSPRTVTTALRHAGAAIRKTGSIRRWGRSRAELQAWDTQLRTEYLAGASVRQLAAAHGYSHNAIRRALARAGTPMRPAARSHATSRTSTRPATVPPHETQAHLTADNRGSGRWSSRLIPPAPT